MGSKRTWKCIILLIFLSFINGACVSRPTFTPGTTAATKPSIPPSETKILVTPIATSTKVPTPTTTLVPNENGLLRLTTNQAQDGDPDWDPEGKRIAFVSEQDGIDEIYVLEMADNRVIRLTKDKAHEKFSPSWSSDGEEIAFNVVIDTVVTVKVLDVTQSSTSPLGTVEIIQLPSLAGAVGSWSPSWSPIENLISFSSDPGASFSIFLIPTDGGDMVPITDEDGEDFSPDWSPDGKQIAFSSLRNENWDIYVINVDGSGLRRISTDEAKDHSPSWSPNGDYIAFYSDRDGNDELYIINVDNNERLTRLTFHPAADRDPVWSPDGSRIVFESDRGGNLDIYLINVPNLGP